MIHYVVSYLKIEAKPFERKAIFLICCNPQKLIIKSAASALFLSDKLIKYMNES
jgi:hypothetical protein